MPRLDRSEAGPGSGTIAATICVVVNQPQQLSGLNAAFWVWRQELE
jgi:hypothetical protein